MNKKGTRRKFAKLLGTAAAAGVLAFALAGCGQQASTDGGSDAAAGGDAAATDENLEPIHAIVGYWGGTCEAPIYVAFENGYFEQCGIDAEPLLITGGTAGPLAAGELDFFQATPNFFPAIKNGTEVTLIDSAHTGCIQAVARPESGIKSIADLPGKKIGTFAANDMGYVFLASAMVDQGLDPSTVEWIVTGDGATTFKYMAEGQIDGFVNFDPYGEIGALAGYTKFFNNAVDKPYADNTCCFVAMNNLTLQKEDGPELARRYCKAMHMASQYLNEHPDEAAAMIQEKGYVADSGTILQSFGLEDTSVDIHQQLIESYTFGGGDKQMYDDSVKFCWEICGKAGALEDAPADPAEYAKYIDDLTARAAVYYGDVD